MMLAVDYMNKVFFVAFADIELLTISLGSAYDSDKANYVRWNFNLLVPSEGSVDSQYLHRTLAISVFGRAQLHIDLFFPLRALRADVKVSVSRAGRTADTTKQVR